MIHYVLDDSLLLLLLFSLIGELLGEGICIKLTNLTKRIRGVNFDQKMDECQSFEVIDLDQSRYTIP